MVLALVVMAGGYLWLKSWLHSEEFRSMLSDRASAGLGVDARFGSFKWDGTVVNCPSFDADGEGLLRRIDAKGLSIDIGLEKVGSRVIELRNARVTQIGVEFDLQKPAVPGSLSTGGGDESASPGGKSEGDSWFSGFVPNQVDLSELKIDRSSVLLEVEGGPIEFAGTRWQVTPGQSEGSYKALGQGGRILFPWKFLPPLEMDEVRIRYQDSSVFVTESNFRVYDRGRLHLAGEASTSGGGFSFDGVLDDVMASEVLPPDWSQKVVGKLESDFTVANRGEGVVVDGSLDFSDGVLTGLPILDSLGAYGGNPRFRRLNLSEASMDYTWEDGDIVLRDIKLGSEGLIRVEGRFRVAKDRQIDGRFKVGLTPGTLARIPGAETKVFLPGERGLLWTSLHVYGTLDDPKEDLTDRLIAAAGMRMFEILPETGEKVLKFTRTAMSEELAGQLMGEDGVIRQGSDLIENGRNLLDGEGDPEAVIRQAEDVVRGVEGIFDFFKGGKSKDRWTNLWRIRLKSPAARTRRKTNRRRIPGVRDGRSIPPSDGHDGKLSYLMVSFLPLPVTHALRRLP